jgi:hypothetical protein
VLLHHIAVTWFVHDGETRRSRHDINHSYCIVVQASQYHLAQRSGYPWRQTIDEQRAVAVSHDAHVGCQSAG